MRKLSKLAAWIVIVALTASLFSGVVFTVSAEPASPLSETYTEATELLTNLQIMDNSTKAWTDAITAEEANTTVKALFFNTFSWSFEQFGLTALAQGETVTGAKLLHLAIAGMLWGTGADETWTEYFHLTDGIENYDPNAQLTREQAAQLYLNVLKANPQYNPQTEIRANALGIKYQLVSYDGMGRPYYQWQRTADNSPLTAVYAAKPLAVLSGDTDWNDIMAAAGISGTVSSTLGGMGYWQLRMFFYRTNIENAGYSQLGWLDPLGDYGAAFQKGWVIEIYDDVAGLNILDIPANDSTAPFSSRAYNLVIYCDLLGEVKTAEGGKTVNMYGQVGGYGDWSGYLAEKVQNVEDGMYIVHWNQGQVVDVVKAKTVVGKVDAITDASVTIDAKIYYRSSRMYVGLDLLTDANIGKTLVFYLDSFDNIVGVQACDHSFGAWADKDAANHAHTCTKCGWEEQQAHEGQLEGYEPPSVTKPGYTGDTVCKHCGKLMQKGEEIPQSTCKHENLNDAVKENEVKQDCEVTGGYDMVVYCHDCGTKISSVHTDLPALEHDWQETANVPAEDRTAGYIDYVCKNNPAHTKHIDLPAKLAGKTNYGEAVAVLKSLGILDADNDFWGDLLTGAEANKILQFLYDGPGFVAEWHPDFAPDATVTGPEFISDALVTIGWNYNNDTLFGNYHNLKKGLGEDYSDTKPLTRDQAAQLLLNVLKANPTYNLEAMKAQDGGVGLTIVKTGEDEFHRPSYKWQKAGVDVTESFADTPITKVRGGSSWNDILNAVNYITDPGIAAAQFRISQEGGEFSAWVEKVHGDNTAVLDKEWILEIYYEYNITRGGYEYSIIAYRSNEILPSEVKPDTKYMEAVELMLAIGLMEKGDWKAQLTGAEANKILQFLYDGPGFVAEWHPDFAPNGTVTSTEFLSDALVTIGWNYGNDPLWAKYNHLEKGLKGDYYPGKRITREEAAQIVLNVFKAIPVYNNAALKANDPGIGLNLVKTGQDAKGRPYYKWQRNGADVTDSYRDTPVATMYGGVVWSDILTAVGDVGEANFEQFFRIQEANGAWSAFAGKQHPNYELFKSTDWAVEIFVEYNNDFTTYAYSIINYEGELYNPDTGSSNSILLAAVCAMFAAGFGCVMLVAGNKKRKA